MVNKVKRSVTLDPDLVNFLEEYSKKNNLKFSQSVNLAIAFFFVSSNEGGVPVKNIIKKLVRKL